MVRDICVPRNPNSDPCNHYIATWSESSPKGPSTMAFTVQPNADIRIMCNRLIARVGHFLQIPPQRSPWDSQGDYKVIVRHLPFCSKCTPPRKLSLSLPTSLHRDHHFKYRLYYLASPSLCLMRISRFIGSVTLLFRTLCSRFCIVKEHGRSTKANSTAILRNTRVGIFPVQVLL